MKKLQGNLFWIILISLFSLVGIKALFHPGLYTAHDIWHQVVRLYYYSSAVSDGQFPPYWIEQLANGFGYPLFFFSYHFPWIIGSLFTSIGINISGTIKILFIISYLTSGITMYFFVERLLRNKQAPYSGNKIAAFLSAVLYLWLPYHFLIIFVGASIGIAFVFLFLPLIFLGIHLIKEKSKSGIPILAIGISGVILSHIMHLIFLSPIIFIFFIWEFASTKQKFIFVRNSLLGVMLAFLVSSFYLIPAAYYANFTRVHEETGFAELYKRNFINFNQLVYSKWGFAPIINNAKNSEISFQLGITQWISVILLTLLFLFRKFSKTPLGLNIAMLLAFTVSIFLMLDHSKIVWSFLVKYVTIDFPFRLLLPASFIASIIAGIVLVNIKKNLQIFVCILFILITFYTNRNHINVNQYTNFPISTYLNLETEITTNTFNEYLPIRAKGQLLSKPWNEITGENLSAKNTKQKTNQLTFDLSVYKESTASVGQFNFPGQTLYLNDKKTEFSTDEEGRMHFTAPSGIHKVTVKYQETILIKISKGLSTLGILIVLFILFKNVNLFKKK